METVKPSPSRPESTFSQVSLPEELKNLDLSPFSMLNDLELRTLRTDEEPFSNVETDEVSQGSEVESLWKFSQLLLKSLKLSSTLLPVMNLIRHLVLQLTRYLLSFSVRQSSEYQ